MNSPKRAATRPSHHRYVIGSLSATKDVVVELACLTLSMLLIVVIVSSRPSARSGANGHAQNSHPVKNVTGLLTLPVNVADMGAIAVGLWPKVCMLILTFNRC